MWLRLRLPPSTSVVSASTSLSWPVMIQKWSTAAGLSLLATVMSPAFWKVAVKVARVLVGVGQHEVPSDLAGAEVDARAIALEPLGVPRGALVGDVEVCRQRAGRHQQRGSQEPRYHEPARKPEFLVHWSRVLLFAAVRGRHG